ncbi:beta-1,3-galactosyltransferase 1-like [Pecten maximus]|uniref:beta-1,3-galactosyltransferase 1-like n=1 Tax=Pecten maximus TaxID=6579 RepID=UPI0014585555|nr:beta-1,3-galactosyltransferase 1-like [Pecten maximus]
MVKLVQEYRRTGYVKNRVINKFTYRYLHNPTNRCASNGGGLQNHTKDVFVVFLVKSKSSHWQQRNAIRQTWGNEHYFNNIYIRTVFVLGTPVNESLNPIWDEIKQFNDIILMDFHDTYFNNTLKTSTSLNWVPEFCPKARFVVLVDDDIYVSLKTLVLFLNRLPAGRRIKLYMGRIYDGYQPHRNTKSKWFVPMSEYPWDTYPPFVAAGTVIMTMDFVSDVRTALPYTKLFRLDDVYLGIIAYKLGVSPVHSSNVYEYRTTSRHKFALTSHGFTPKQMKLAWQMHKSREQSKNIMIP